MNVPTSGFEFRELVHMRNGEIEYTGTAVEFAMLNVCEKRN